MSKVLLDHVPPRAPHQPDTGNRAAAARRSRTEAGIVGLAIGAAVLLAAGFWFLFPEASRSPSFWPTYGDPGDAFSIRHPRDWTAATTDEGVVLRGDDGMSVAITPMNTNGADVGRLAADAIRRVGDVGAAEPAAGWVVGGLPTAAIHELMPGGQETTRIFVQTGADRYVEFAATAPAGAFDTALFARMLETARFPAFDEHIAADRMGQERS